MIEAIVTYLVVSKIINCFFIAVMVNAGAFELLFGAAVVLGILLMVASPNKFIGTVILVGGVSFYVIATMMLPYASVIASWARHLGRHLGSGMGEAFHLPLVPWSWS